MTFSTIVFVMLKSFGLCNVGIFSQFSIILWEWSLNLHWKWGNSTHLQNFFRYEFRFCYSLLLKKHFTIKPLTHLTQKMTSARSLSSFLFRKWILHILLFKTSFCRETMYRYFMDFHTTIFSSKTSKMLSNI